MTLRCDHKDARVCVVCYPSGLDPREGELLALRRRVLNQRRELRRLNRALAAAQKSETMAHVARLHAQERAALQKIPETCGETRWGVLRPASPDLPVRRCIREPMHTSQVKHTDGEVFW